MWTSTLASSCRISVLRHGESENNVLGIECTDISNKNLYGLTNTGTDQIRGAVREARDVDIILSSPLRRARETASIASARYDVPVITEELLIEHNVGIFERKSEVERLAWKLKYGSTSYPEGESHKDVESRARILIDKLSEQYRDRHVLLVTHAAFLRCFCREVFDDIEWDNFCELYFGRVRKIFDVQSYEHLT